MTVEEMLELMVVVMTESWTIAPVLLFCELLSVVVIFLFPGSSCVILFCEELVGWADVSEILIWSAGAVVLTNITDAMSEVSAGCGSA